MVAGLPYWKAEDTGGVGERVIVYREQHKLAGVFLFFVVKLRGWSLKFRGVGY